MREDFPVPRGPQRSALFAGRPARNCRVFCTSVFFCRSICRRSDKVIGLNRVTTCKRPCPAFFRQRQAIPFSISSSVSRGRSRSRRLTRRPACSKNFSTLSTIVRHQIPVSHSTVSPRPDGAPWAGALGLGNLVLCSGTSRYDRKKTAVSREFSGMKNLPDYHVSSAG